MMECAECEHDLRAGHDPSCSRYHPFVCMDCGSIDECDEEGTCRKCFGEGEYRKAYTGRE